MSKDFFFFFFEESNDFGTKIEIFCYLECFNLKIVVLKALKSHFISPKFSNKLGLGNSNKDAQTIQKEIFAKKICKAIRHKHKRIKFAANIYICNYL